MPSGPSLMRCVVLDAGTGTVDRPALRAAAEFACLLRLEMLGVFIENPSLLALATLPFARELRLPGYGWQSMQPQRIDDELRAIALQARELFHQEIGSRGVTGRFEVRRGNPETLTGDVARPSDILIVIEPGATEALTSSGELMRRAAFSSPASLLLLPRSGMPSHGPVAAVWSSESDACYALASRIAVATGEEAVAIPPQDGTSSAALLASLARTLGPRRERLLVIPREGSTLDALLPVASQRQTPVLLVAG